MGAPHAHRSPALRTLLACLLPAAAIPLALALTLARSQSAAPRFTFATGPDLPAGSARELQSTARQCFTAIADLDVSRLATLTSQDGLRVVDRLFDYDRRGKARPGQHGRPPLAFRDRDSGFWVDQEWCLWRGHFHDPEPLRILGAYQGLIRQGYGPVHCGLALMEIDGSDRCLGPAAALKYCAGSYCYLCFKREGDAWRLYRLEFCSH